MTVAESQQIPNPPGGVYELYHGELVEVRYPKYPLVRAQGQLRGLLEAAAGTAGVAEKENRPLPEHDCWSADVVAVLQEKRQICMGNGSREFWTVNTDLRKVEVSTPDGHIITYKSGRQIPLFFGGRIAVNEIFA
jgi:hypothetical protein